MMIIFSFGMFSISAFAEEQVKKEEYSYTSDGYGDAKKLVEIPYGDSEESLGHQGGYGEKISPKSFLIEKNGNIYVLDTINKAIKKYLSDGTYDKMILLPENIYGLDIEKVGDFLFVYADNHKLYMINENMPETYWTVMNVSSWDMAGLYVSDGDLYIRSYEGADKKLQLAMENSRNERLMAKESAPVCISNENTIVLWQKEENAINGFSNEKDTETLSLTCRLDPLGAFYVGKMGNVEYVVTNETNWSYAETRVTKFVDGERTESALVISGKEYAFGSPFKKIYIQNDAVYQMVPVENGIEFYQIPWNSLIQTRFSEEMIEEFKEEERIEKDLEEEQSIAEKASVNVSRTEAMDRAYAMCGKGWYYNAATMHTPTTSTTKSPEQLGSTSKTIGGIPYCWGGMNGLDTATYSGSRASYMQNFDDALTSGKTAGNIHSEGHYWIGSTFGIDCSGLIAAAFKIPEKVGTGSLGTYFTLSDWRYVKAGDVAISTSEGHTFMIKYIYPKDTRGNYKMSTYESTTDGSTQCAKVHERKSETVINTYKLYTY
jgi:cell wall-associated NlpC family hydrolase